jgi:hypothetical protein
MSRGGLGSKGLCGIPSKKSFKIPKKHLFVTFCMGDYKSLAAIAALPQWPVHPWSCQPKIESGSPIILGLFSGSPNFLDEFLDELRFQDSTLNYTVII